MPGDSRRFRNLVPLAATQAVGLACGVIGVRWASGVIPPETLGLYGLLVGAAQAGVVVTHQGLIRHVQGNWNTRLSAANYGTRWLRSAVTPTLWLAAGLLGVLLVVHQTGGVPLHPAAFAWLLAVNLGLVVTTALQSALQAEERYWANFWASAAGSITRSFLPPLLAGLVAANLTVVSTGFLVHVACLVAVSGWLMRSAWSRPDEGPAANAATLDRAVWAFAGAGLCNWVAAASVRWIAAGALDAAQTGYFVLAGNLSQVVPAMFSSVLFSYGFPSLFSAARAGATTGDLQRLNYRVLAVLLLGSQAGILALAWLAPHLIGPLIATRYTPATDWLLATGNATLAASTAQFFHNVLLARQRERACLWLSVVSLGVRVALMLTGAWLGGSSFRTCLIVLPWLTVAVEAACMHWLLRGIASSPTTQDNSDPSLRKP